MVVAEDAQWSVKEALKRAKVTEEAMRTTKEDKKAAWATEKVLKEAYGIVKVVEHKAVADLTGKLNAIFKFFICCFSSSTKLTCFLVQSIRTGSGLNSKS
ncbi:hypothetical protein ABZP36_010356 [Zizania latifolia]